jgi:hypothetical protein
MTGRRPGSAARRFQGAGRSLHYRHCRPRVGSRTVVRSCRHPTGSGSIEVCPARVGLPSRPSWPPGAGPVDRPWPQERPHDAVSVAVAARSVPSLRQVGVEDQAVVLHLLTKRRQDLVAARTQTINRLLVDLVPGGARRNLTAKWAAALLAAVTPAGQAAVTRHELAADLVADVCGLEQRIASALADSILSRCCVVPRSTRVRRCRRPGMFHSRRRGRGHARHPQRATSGPCGSCARAAHCSSRR